MTGQVMKKLPKVSAEEKEEVMKRAGKNGGSITRKKTGARLLTRASVSAKFQREHGIEDHDYVTIRFNPTTKVLDLIFRKKEIKGETYAVSRTDGTAYVQLDSTFNRFDLELTTNKYRDEYVFKNGHIYIDLSNEGKVKYLTAKKDPAVEIRRDGHGAWIPFNKKEKAAAERARLAIVEKARGEDDVA